MNTEEIKEYILNYFKNNNIEITDSALGVILHERYLNQEYLEELTDKEIKDGIEPILELTKKNYENRVANRKVEGIKVTKVDIRGAVKSQYGKMPPFAKKKAPVEEVAETTDGEESGEES